MGNETALRFWKVSASDKISPKPNGMGQIHQQFLASGDAVRVSALGFRVP